MVGYYLIIHDRWGSHLIVYAIGFPISVFNKDLVDNKQIRICFAKTTETLLKAAEIIITI